jgi:hypothetical protein
LVIIYEDWPSFSAIVSYFMHAYANIKYEAA